MPRRVAIMLDLNWSFKRHSAIYAGAQRYAQEQGWHSIIDEFADDTLPARPARKVPYDGVIARANKKLVRRARRLNVPVVNVWLSSPAWKSAPGVFADFAAIGRLRAEHLLSRGLHRFAALISEDERAQALELGGFTETLAEEGYPCITGKVPLDPCESLQAWRETERAITAWMNDWQTPMGVYVGAEIIGRMVAQICHNRGWRVPEDVAIIAGWNEETFCEHVRPTLTSVEVGYDRIGYEAARLLGRLMGEAKKGSGSGERILTPVSPEHVLLPPQGMIVRESTDFFAVDDPVMAAALEFIAANAHRRIGQDDVAHAAMMETRTLQRHFRKFIGRPIVAEVRRVRLERAKRELAQSQRKIAEISRDVGFGPPMRMYEVFVRELGVTPTAYRKQRQLGKND